VKTQAKPEAKRQRQRATRAAAKAKMQALPLSLSERALASELLTRSTLLPLVAAPELLEPEPELPPEMLELSELPEFRRLAELLGRLGLAQHLPLCIEHEFDMDTLLTCGTHTARQGGRAVIWHCHLLCPYGDSPYGRARMTSDLALRPSARRGQARGGTCRHRGAAGRRRDNHGGSSKVRGR
jgi:hypothetical protein